MNTWYSTHVMCMCIYIYINTQNIHPSLCMYIQFYCRVSCRCIIQATCCQGQNVAACLVRKSGAAASSPWPQQSSVMPARDPCCVLRMRIHRPKRQETATMRPMLSLGITTAVKCQIQSNILLVQSNRGTFASPDMSAKWKQPANVQVGVSVSRGP